MTVRRLAEAAREASRHLALTSAAQRNDALLAVAAALERRRDAVTEANRLDLERAARDELAAPLLKRLAFSGLKIDEAIAGLRSVAALPDPLNRVLERSELDEGLVLSRVRCPIGVIGVIFESRPDALIQISALCLKSGNAVLLKGGREALKTNRLLAELVREAAQGAGIPDGWIQLLETRAEVSELLALHDVVDLVIPRGSNEFVRHIMTHSSIPVMGHADGICHVYVDAAADLNMALNVVEDSKCQYVVVCNAAETLLVHESVADVFLPRLQERLGARGVQLRGCARTVAHIGVAAAREEDWRTEYLDSVLSIRVVNSIEEAIAHIHGYGSGHTEAIVTSDPAAAERFLARVDAGSVFWNASTRFADGYRYGLGAEVGISTSKLHARGPVGLDGLLSYKWQLRGQGHIVAPYVSSEKAFRHQPLPVEEEEDLPGRA